MIETILASLIRANLAAGAAILLVLAIRRLARPRFGARAAYALWLAPLAAGLAALPAHTVTPSLITPVMQSAAITADDFVAAAAPVASGPDAASLAFAVWMLGMAGAVLLTAWRQGRFIRAMGRLEPSAEPGVFRAEHAGVGPAVVGTLRARIVTPADFETRFAADERALILAHERVHLAGGDAGANALACAMQCLCWFNPLVHLGARLARIDQELACDAAVIARRPEARRAYGELLLKTQLFTQALPLGCHWPAPAEHPLKERIAMLKSPPPGRAMRVMGLVAVAGLTLGAASMAWAALPEARGMATVSFASAASDNNHLAPAEAARLAGPGDAVMCRPDANRELHDCWIKGTAFAVIPTPAEVVRAWPTQARRAGLTGSVTLRCTPTYATQRLEKCEGYHYAGAAERPEFKAAFERAAIRVISVNRLKAHPQPTDFVLSKTPLFFSVDFNDHPTPPGGRLPSPPPTHYPDWMPGPPKAADAARPASSVTQAKPVRYLAPEAAPTPRPAPVIVQPDWITKPVSADVADVYPSEAAKAGLPGEATIGCVVSAEGRLMDCKVVREAPAEAGFGAAAMKLSERFQMKPMSRDGQPVSGGVVRIPFRFSLPRAPQPVTPS